MRNMGRRFIPAATVFCALLPCYSQKPAETYAERYVPQSRSTVPPEKRIDINHAELRDLLQVPGMSPSWARRIVRFRPYRTKLELLDSGIVPDRIYFLIKDYLIAHRDKE